MSAYGPPGAQADGCCGPTVCRTVTASVGGCSGGNWPMIGCTLELQLNGATVDTKVTDATGYANLTAPSASSTSGYRVRCIPPTAIWWNQTPILSAAFNVSCTSGSPGASFILNPATNWQCGNIPCPRCRDPLWNDPNVSHGTLTDSNGTYALRARSCCYTKTNQGIYVKIGGGSGNCVAGGTGTVAVGYTLGCPQTSSNLAIKDRWALTQNYSACCDPYWPPTMMAPGDCNATGNPGFAPRATGGSLCDAVYSSNTFYATTVSGPNDCNGTVTFNVTNAYVNGTVTATIYS